MEKICSKCKVEKDVSMFSKDCQKKDGHQSICKQCRKDTYSFEYNKQYREERKEYLALQSKIYRETHKEELGEKSKAYREKHKEEKAIADKIYRENNKEYLSERRKKYASSEKGKEIIRACHRTRKAKIKGAKIGEVDYEEINRRDNNTCQLCKKKVDMMLEYPDPMSKSYDHIVPISLNGEHSTRNLQLTHLVCNLRKNKNISEGVQMHLL